MSVNEIDDLLTTARYTRGRLLQSAERLEKDKITSGSNLRVIESVIGLIE